MKNRLGHRVADWSEQVVLGVEDLNVSASNERSESILFVKILPCFRPIDIEPNVFFVVSWHILLLLYYVTLLKYVITIGIGSFHIQLWS